MLNFLNDPPQKFDGNIKFPDSFTVMSKEEMIATCDAPIKKFTHAPIIILKNRKK